MKFFTFVLLSLLSVSIFAQAEGEVEASNNNTKKIEELMVLVKAENMMNAFYSEIDTYMRTAGAQMGIPPEHQGLYDEYVARVMRLVQKEADWEKYKAPLVDIYGSNFTSEEINGMIAFYKTPVGQASIEKLPKVMQESMSIGQQMMQALSPQVQGLMKEFQEKIKAAQGTNPLAPAPAPAR